MKRSAPEPGRSIAPGAYLHASQNGTLANATPGSNTAATGTSQPTMRPAAPLPGGASLHSLAGMLPPLPVQLAGAVSQAPVFRPASQGSAAPPALGSGTTVQPGSKKDVWQDQALLDRVRQAVALGPWDWSYTCMKLEKEERERFLVASLSEIAGPKGSAYWHWQSALQYACGRVSMTHLLAQQWPQERNLVHLLVSLRANQLLDRVLATEEGKRCLFKSDRQGASPLHVAVAFGNKEATGKILACDDAAGTLRMASSLSGRLPLHLAAIVGADDCAQLLLSCKGKEQRMLADRFGCIPLMLALHCGGAKEELVKRLLAECAEEQTRCLDRYGWNSLVYAVFVDSMSAVLALLAVKSTLAQQLAARTAKGNNARDFARQHGHGDIQAVLESAMQDLPATSSSTASTASSATTSSQAGPRGGNHGPVPMTPLPLSPQAGQDFDTVTEEDGPY